MPGMGTVMHFIKTSPHIEHITASIHQRDVNGRTPAVIRTDRHIHHILWIRTGIPQYRLRLLWAVCVIHHQ